jgi:hypothetical protein
MNGKKLTSHPGARPSGENLEPVCILASIWKALSSWDLAALYGLLF